MKKRIIFFILFVTVLFCISCKSDNKNIDLYEAVKNRGKLIIGLEGTWSPWNYHNEKDELVGFDTEVGKKIAEKLGVKAEFVEGAWDGLLEGVNSGRYDMMINGVASTEERKRSYDFSIPYAYIKTAIIVREDDDRINLLADLKNKKTANTISSNFAKIAEDNGAEVVSVDDLNHTFELLLSGRVDATLNTEVTYYDYIKEHPDAPIRIALLIDDKQEVCIPIKKSEQTKQFKNKIDEAILELKNEGVLSDLSYKYFDLDITN